MRRRTFVLAGIAAAVGGAAGCSGSKSHGTPVKATLLTSYGQRGRDAYLYVAREKGYLRAAGFDVTIEPGADRITNLQRIAAGGPVFAPVDVTGCLLGLARGSGPSDFTFLAAIHQRTTAAIFAPSGTGIDSPGDLAGRTLADLPGSNARELFPTYARLAGIAAGRVGWVPGTVPDLPGELSGGRFDGVGESVASRRLVESVIQGRTAVMLAYGDKVQDLYGDALATSAGYARANPDRVRAFTAALLKGLADTIDDPAAAGVIMHKYVPGVTPQAATDEVTLLAAYVRSAAAGLPVGALDVNRVARSIAVLQGTGQILGGLTPDQVMDPALAPTP